MQAIATWLVARPQNAVLGLLATLLIGLPFLGGAVIGLLVLRHGLGFAAIAAGLAVGILGVASLVAGNTAYTVIALLVLIWVPAAALAEMLGRTRSLTLVMQVLTIFWVVAMLSFQLFVEDPAAFWQPYLTAGADWFRQNGLALNVELVTAEVMTASVGWSLWFIYTVILLAGYWFYRQLPEESRNFGEFRQLNFGRVIALVLVSVALLAFAIDAIWLQNIMFATFMMFMMQGLAVVHWFYGKGVLPVVALVSVYVSLLFLQELLGTVLALIGYLDAWFGLRRRFTKA